MKGYQADMDGQQQYTGQIYEERRARLPGHARTVLLYR